MPYFDGSRGRLHYRRGSVDHPSAALALLPGIGQHSGHYHRFARALGASGIELWTLDTSGHGLSEGDPDRPGTLPELAADALAFLSRIRTNTPKPLFLMGHSLGAATALATLREPGTPLAGLVLCGTPESVLDGRSPKSARGVEDARLGDPHAAADITRARAPRSDAARPSGRRSDEEPVLPEGLPVLVVHGVDDRRAPIARVREWANRAPIVFHEYADAGHDLLHEPVHAQVTTDIAEWIATLPTTPSPEN